MQNTEYEVIVKRLDQLEKGLLDIRQQIDILLNTQKEPKKRFKTGEEVMVAYASNKQENAKIIESVFADIYEKMGVSQDFEPMSVKEVRESMRQRGIRPEDNEFSQAIIAEREK